MTEPTRYRLERGGILNVWQYDRQVFELAEGRLLLRGANGAGKSKTMEMLLPFAIDGDKARLTASGRHHTSLLWLMLDGYDGQARTGYVWVEFSRAVENGPPETLTFGVGIRATQSARAATAWYFTSSRRVGADLVLEDDAGPLSRQQLEAALEEDPAGQVFEQAARYREHVGRLLFGLPGDQYDDLLRLIYWLRQPQVGEDIDPKRLAEQLVNALPQLDDDALRSAGSTFDELEAYGEQIEGRARAAEALGRFAEVYRGYAAPCSPSTHVPCSTQRPGSGRRRQSNGGSRPSCRVCETASPRSPGRRVQHRQTPRRSRTPSGRWSPGRRRGRGRPCSRWASGSRCCRLGLTTPPGTETVLASERMAEPARRSRTRAPSVSTSRRSTLPSTTSPAGWSTGVSGRPPARSRRSPCCATPTSG